MQHSCMKRFVTIKRQARIIVPVYTLYGMLWSRQNCLCISIDREESEERKYKRITMAQWINRLRNNSFVNATE